MMEYWTDGMVGRGGSGMMEWWTDGMMQEEDV
jgi:hypothetical protein